MNTAAKNIHQDNIFNGQLLKLRFPKPFLAQGFLGIILLISALAVIYVTNNHRLLCTQMENAEQESHLLEVHWGQLLLEQASLARSARVQKLATEQLNMVLPDERKTHVIDME